MKGRNGTKVEEDIEMILHTLEATCLGVDDLGAFLEFSGEKSHLSGNTEVVVSAAGSKVASDRAEDEA